jgi:hypothetical protein
VEALSRLANMLYFHRMKTKYLKKERVSSWPKDAQDELVRPVAEIETRYTEVYRLNDEERAALNRSAVDIQKSRFATDQEVEAVFDRL